MGTHDRSCTGDLHRSRHDRYLTCFPAKAYRPDTWSRRTIQSPLLSTTLVTTDPASHRPSSSAGLAAARRVCCLNYAAARARRPARRVIDLHQVVRDDRLHRLTGQHDRHPIPEPRQSDRPALIPPTAERRHSQIRRWDAALLLPIIATATTGSTTSRPDPRQRKPFARCTHSSDWCGRSGVVIDHPPVQRRLQFAVVANMR